MATTKTKIKNKNKMNTNNKSSDEAHSEPLQQCNVVGSASSKYEYVNRLTLRESVAIIEARIKERNKNQIMIFMAANELKPTKKNLQMLLKNKAPIEAFTGLNYWEIQIALEEMIPPRTITAIEKEIKKIEDRRLEYCRNPRSSSGAYSQTNNNFSHKLRILNNELERAKSFKALNG